MTALMTAPAPTALPALGITLEHAEFVGTVGELVEMTEAYAFAEQDGRVSAWLWSELDVEGPDRRVHGIDRENLLDAAGDALKGLDQFIATSGATAALEAARGEVVAVVNG